MDIVKRGMNVSLSEEMLYTVDPRFPARSVERVEEIPITEEQRASHARAVAAIEELNVNEWIAWGSDSDVVRPLEPKRITHYAETHEKWLERCRAIAAEGTVGA